MGHDHIVSYGPNKSSKMNLLGIDFEKFLLVPRELVTLVFPKQDQSV